MQMQTAIYLFSFFYLSWLRMKGKHVYVKITVLHKWKYSAKIPVDVCQKFRTLQIKTT